MGPGGLGPGMPGPNGGRGGPGLLKGGRGPMFLRPNSIVKKDTKPNRIGGGI